MRTFFHFFIGMTPFFPSDFDADPTRPSHKDKYAGRGQNVSGNPASRGADQHRRTATQIRGALSPDVPPVGATLYSSTAGADWKRRLWRDEIWDSRVEKSADLQTLRGIRADAQVRPYKKN
jgi:hypothetical protein